MKVIVHELPILTHKTDGYRTPYVSYPQKEFTDVTEYLTNKPGVIRLHFKSGATTLINISSMRYLTIIGEKNDKNTST